MAVMLRRLVEKVGPDYELLLLAGEKGLNRVVRWLHMVEGIDISDFLTGNELAFTTGIALKDISELMELARENVKNNAAGMIVNIGPFIKEVPQEVIDYCNEADFPLFSVPWHVHMAEIMRLFSFEILESEKAAIELSAAVKNAMYFPNQTDSYVPALEKNNFQVGWTYRIGVIEPENVTETNLTIIQKQIEIILTSIIDKAFSFIHNETVIVVFANSENPKIMYTVQMAINRLSLFTNIGFYMGLGRQIKSVNCIAKSYRQAINAVKLYRKSGRLNECANYNELGVYTVLMAIEDNVAIEEYCDEKLSMLRENDRLNGTDYIKTLKCYLGHNGSVIETAKALYIHRNTVNYKINRIEELLGYNLSDLDNRFSIMLALYLNELL